MTATFHKIPMLRFEDIQLTSFPGLIVFALLFILVELQIWPYCGIGLLRRFKQAKHVFEPLIRFGSEIGRSPILLWQRSLQLAISVWQRMVYVNYY